MSRWSVIAAAAALSSAIGVWWLLDRTPPVSAIRLRVAQRLDRPANVAAVDPVKLAAAARLRWTASDIERAWTRLGSDESQTYRSPAIAISSGRLLAIVAALPATGSTAAATLLWSRVPVLSPEDFARNRQELRARGGAGIVLLRGDSVQIDREPIQHLFLHVPAGEQLAGAIDTLSVVQWSDLAPDGVVGPIRATLGTEAREVVTGGASARVSYEIAIAPPAWISFGVFVESASPSRIRVRAGGRDKGTELLGGDVAPGAWHDFTVPVEGSALRELSFEAESVSASATVHWSTPLLLQPDDGPERPNIVLYVVDALRADALGAYGSTAARTPALDALAREGLVFERAYSAASWTKPSVTTLLTSLYPMTHGLGARLYSDQFPSSAWTLQQALAAAGYTTAQFSANPFTGALSNLDRGFDAAVMAPGLSSVASEARSAGHADAIHERFLAWLSSRRNQRFFAYVQPLDTHPPFAVEAATARAAYDASLAALDTEIDALRRGLATLGLDRNTLFILTADHGEAFGEHGRTGHGQTVYDEEVRVPLILYWPGRIAPGRIGEPVHHVDLAPTILAGAGLAPPDHLQGRSLWPGGGNPRPSPVIITRSVYPEDIESPMIDRAEAIAIVDHPWKLIRSELPDGRRRIELYQLDDDPLERQNQSQSEPARARMLTAALDRFLVEQGAARTRFAGKHGQAGAPPARPVPSRELLDRLRSLGYVR